MGISERKAREKEKLHDNIIAVALEMFIEEGYEKVSIRKIAEAIEYSPATIYLYFKNKDELMFLVQQQAFNQFFELLAPVLEIEDPLEQLWDLGRKYLDFGFNNSELYDLMFMLQSPMNAAEAQDEGWECGLETFHLLEVIVMNCQKAGYYPSRDSHIVSMELWAFVHGMMSLFLTDRLMMVQKEQQEVMMQTTMNTYMEVVKAGKK